MSNKMCSIIASLWLALLTIGLGTGTAWASTGNTLKKISKQESGDQSRISLEFSSLPSYRLETTGDGLKLFLADTALAPAFKNLPADDTLKEASYVTEKHQIILSLTLHRPPKQVSAAFTMRGTDRRKRTAAQGADNLLILDILAEEKPAAKPPKPAQTPPAATPAAGPTDRAPEKQESKTRPANTSNLPEAAQAAKDTATTSQHNDKWLTFFSDHVTPFRISPRLRYSLPPFPVLDLVQPDTASKLLSPLLLAQGRAGLLDDVATALKKLNSDPQLPAEQMERALLTYGEVLIRQGSYAEADRVLQLATGVKPDSAFTPLIQYLTILNQAQAAIGKPHEASYALANTKQDQTESGAALAPYLRLLRAEIALDTERDEEALRILSGDPQPADGQAAELFSLRRADAWAVTDRADEALTAYRQPRQHGIMLDAHPFSLARYASALFEKQEYAAAAEAYLHLSIKMYGAPGQDVAQYATALSRLKGERGNKNPAPFNEIVDRFPETEGAARARLKVADLAVLTGKNSLPVSPDAVYKIIAAQAPLRELREEAAFKQALVLFIKGDNLQASNLLHAFLRDHRAGALRRQAEALQLESLPVAAKKLIDKKEYIPALVLAEQNRDLLISGQAGGDFLAELGLAFASLCLWNSAAKTYRYLLDAYKGTPAEEKIYLPLMQALAEQDEHQMVIDYASHYFKHFAKGTDQAAIQYLLVNALHTKGQDAAAAEQLAARDYPGDRPLNLLAGQVFWDLKQYDKVEEYTGRLMDNDLSKAAPKEIFLRAEALFMSGHPDKALPLYQHLLNAPDYADQALYRSAQIRLTEKKTAEGLKLLRNLAEKGKSTLWRKMAEETLAVNNLQTAK